jgi:hypothetical protein
MTKSVANVAGVTIMSPGQYKGFRRDLSSKVIVTHAKTALPLGPSRAAAQLVDREVLQERQ